MTPQATLANDYFTSSSATTPAAHAQVVHLGAVSVQPAETVLGAPEDAIDYELGVETLLNARDVEESEASSVATSSPFGI